MIANYFKIAIRNILRNKVYAVINIMGLAVGMACCIIILLWVQDELSYDRFHENSDDIYRVIQHVGYANQSRAWAITQGPLGPSLERDFPEIINTARFAGSRFLLTHQDKNFYEPVILADGSLFEMFDFPLVKGDPTRALFDPNFMVLSEEMADKHFGEKDPIGKIITVNQKHAFVITGVMKNIPKNSNLSGVGIIIPFIFGRELTWAVWGSEIRWTVDDWGNSSFYTFIQLRKGVSQQEIEPKISEYLSDKPTVEGGERLSLQSLKKIHLYSNYDWDWAHGDIKYVLAFFIVGIFILLIACINYMNLATARSSNRAKEVGLRKVVGAFKSDIVKQLLGESILIAFIALLLALLIVEFMLPIFNNLTGKEFGLEIAANRKGIFGLLTIVLLTGFVSGSYPALFLSAFHPAGMLKGPFRYGVKGGKFRKFLIVTQFSLAILIIICTAVVYMQVQFIQKKKLGYDREHLVFMQMPGDMWKHFETVKNELSRNPNIMTVTASSSVPTRGYAMSNAKWDWEGKNPDDKVLMRNVFIHDDYFKTLSIKIAAGRAFSKAIPTDRKVAIMVNEAAAEVMGIQNAVGQQMTYADNKDHHFTVVGVVKNYHFRSLHWKIEPLVFIYSPDSCRVLFAKLNSDDMTQSIEYIEKVWKKYASGYPFKYNFIDESLDRLYTSEKRIGKIFSYFSLLTVFIACLGLFGLASFLAEQRTKEIGVRKALGATISSIALLLTKEFIKWVLVANIIAWPIAYFASNKWLQNYAYRINIGAGPFFLSAFLAVIIALITVGYQAIKAARANPVDSLRYE